MTGEFPAQTDSNAENVSIQWRHHIYLKEKFCILVQISTMFVLKGEIANKSSLVQAMA